MDFREKLILLRNSNKLSQEELAEGLGVSRQAVAKWETGKSLPDLGNLIELGRIFGTGIDRLIKEENNCTTELIKTEQNGKEEFLDFLLRAKKATYAGYGPEVSSTRPLSHDLSYEEGDYLYYDTYLGGEKFAGEEAVWRLKKPFWAMNYVGRVLNEEFNGDFLKKALAQSTKDSPYRGPGIYQEKEFTYHNTVEGNTEWFQGKEEIFRSGVKVYECFYHGGYVI